MTVNKRMSKRVSLNGTYTWSKMMEENGGDNIIGGNNTTNPLITEIDRVVQRSLVRKRSPSSRDDLRRLPAAVRPRRQVPQRTRARC